MTTARRADSKSTPESSKSVIDPAIMQNYAMQCTRLNETVQIAGQAIRDKPAPAAIAFTELNGKIAILKGYDEKTTLAARASQLESEYHTQQSNLKLFKEQYNTAKATTLVDDELKAIAQRHEQIKKQISDALIAAADAYIVKKGLTLPDDRAKILSQLNKKFIFKSQNIFELSEFGAIEFTKSIQEEFKNFTATQSIAFVNAIIKGTNPNGSSHDAYTAITTQFSQKKLPLTESSEGYLILNLRIKIPDFKASTDQAIAQVEKAQKQITETIQSLEGISKRLTALDQETDAAILTAKEQAEREQAERHAAQLRAEQEAREEAERHAAQLRAAQEAREEAERHAVQLRAEQAARKEAERNAAKSKAEQEAQAVKESTKEAKRSHNPSPARTVSLNFPKTIESLATDIQSKYQVLKEDHPLYQAHFDALKELRLLQRTDLAQYESLKNRIETVPSIMRAYSSENLAAIAVWAKRTNETFTEQTTLERAPSTLQNLYDSPTLDSSQPIQAVPKLKISENKAAATPPATTTSVLTRLSNWFTARRAAIAASGAAGTGLTVTFILGLANVWHPGGWALIGIALGGGALLSASGGGLIAEATAPSRIDAEIQDQRNTIQKVVAEAQKIPDSKVEHPKRFFGLVQEAIQNGKVNEALTFLAKKLNSKMDASGKIDTTRLTLFDSYCLHLSQRIQKLKLLTNLNLLADKTLQEALLKHINNSDYQSAMVYYNENKPKNSPASVSGSSNKGMFALSQNNGSVIPDNLTQSLEWLSKNLPSPTASSAPRMKTK